MRDIRSQSGWGWDHINSVPDVPLDVWVKYVEVRHVLLLYTLKFSLATETPEGQAVPNEAIPPIR